MLILKQRAFSLLEEALECKIRLQSTFVSDVVLCSSRICIRPECSQATKVRSQRSQMLSTHLLPLRPELQSGDQSCSLHAALTKHVLNTCSNWIHVNIMLLIRVVCRGESQVFRDGKNFFGEEERQLAQAENVGPFCGQQAQKRCTSEAHISQLISMKPRKGKFSTCQKGCQYLKIFFFHFRINGFITEL